MKTTIPAAPKPKRDKARAPNPGGAGSIDKIQKFDWKLEDEPGVPYLLSKHEMRIDEDYQREVYESKVLAIAANWSWLACGALLIAEREPSVFFVFDGGHRREAAMRRSDIDELPCVVFKLTSKQQEAMAFYRANCNRKTMSSYHKLRALLVAEDSVALDAVALMHAEGFRPVPSGGAANTVACIAAFMSAFRAQRSLMISAWPIIARLHHGMPLHEKVMRAFLYTSKNGTESLTSRKWRERIMEIGFAPIKQAVDRAAAERNLSGERIWALGLVEVLNKGLRSSRIKLKEANEVRAE